jgi:hypothetical protein
MSRISRFPPVVASPLASTTLHAAVSRWSR